MMYSNLGLSFRETLPLTMGLCVCQGEDAAVLHHHQRRDQEHPDRAAVLVLVASAHGGAQATQITPNHNLKGTLQRILTGAENILKCKECPKCCGAGCPFFHFKWALYRSFLKSIWPLCVLQNLLGSSVTIWDVLQVACSTSLIWLCFTVARATTISSICWDTCSPALIGDNCIPTLIWDMTLMYQQPHSNLGYDTGSPRLIRYPRNFLI